jgi:hypothetical protein
MVSPDAATLDAWAAGFLELAPDGAQAEVCAGMIGALAAQLALLVGSREASASLYAIADLAATTHIPEDAGRG